MRRVFIASLMILLPFGAHSQVVVSGNVQSDVMIPHEDRTVGAEKQEDILSNTYAGLSVNCNYLDAGFRVEYLEHPLYGFEKDFKGWGLPFFYVKGKLDKVELTAGTFYEQFGSGFVLRTYEERSLGIDNSLLGGSLLYKPFKGITIKALTGRQRRYWEWNKSLISGFDAEFSVDELIPLLKENNSHLTVGASWVNRYENSNSEIFADPTHKLNLPVFVNAWDFRIGLDQGPLSFLAEYAGKTDDPSYANGYIYHNGSVAMLSGSYSQKGFSVLLQAKRSEDMSFKSTDDPMKAIGISSTINHLPAFTMEHTYALASLYPYATQLADGEWAYQGEVGYSFKRNTVFGGRYGMNLKLNASYIRNISRDFKDGGTYNTLAGTLSLAGTDGYETSFFRWGDQTLYQDFNVQLSRRLSKDIRLFVMYMNQRCNMTVVEGSGGMVNSDIVVADFKYQLLPKMILRGEMQYLFTDDDKGDWAFGLMEMSFAPHWMITLSDQYNAGETKIHYYFWQVSYSKGSHRMQAGYGRMREGYNCSGGVCRYVPASKGLLLSYNYSF